MVLGETNFFRNECCNMLLAFQRSSFVAHGIGNEDTEKFMTATFGYICEEVVDCSGSDRTGYYHA